VPHIGERQEINTHSHFWSFFQILWVRSCLVIDGTVQCTFYHIHGSTASFTTTFAAAAVILRLLYWSACISQHPSYKLEDCAGAKFYCLYVIADAN